MQKKGFRLKETHRLFLLVRIALITWLSISILMVIKCEYDRVIICRKQLLILLKILKK